jgi:hypothetical protein
VLSHLDPFRLSDTDQAPALASDLVFISNAVILDYPIMPAMPQPPFPDLLVPEYLSLTLRASDGYHFF